MSEDVVEIEVEREVEVEVVLDPISIILEMLRESVLPLGAFKAAASEQVTFSY